MGTAPRQSRRARGAKERSIAGNAWFSLVVKVTTSAFTAASTLFLARYLGPQSYGVLALALSVSMLLVRPADLGISASAARFAAEHHNDFPAVARVVADALRLKLLAAGGVAVALIATAGPIADLYGKPGLAWPLRAAALALFGQSVLMLPIASFSALRRVPLQLRVVAAESVVELGSIVGLVLLGTGATGAAFGRASGYLFGAVVGVAVLARLLGRGALAVWRPQGRGREIARYARSLFLVDAAMTLYEEIDIVLIGAFLSAGQVAFFQAPLRLVTFLQYPGQAIASGVTPRMAKSATGPDVPAFMTALRVILLVQMPLAVGVAVWAQPVVRLTLGAGYEPSADVLRAIAPYVLLAGLAPLVSLAVTYAGGGQRRVAIAVVSLGVNVLIDLLLIPQIGILAGVIGSTVAFCVYVPWHLMLCRSMFDLSLRPLVATLGRALLAGAAMAGVLALVGVRDLSVAGWLIGGTGGVLAYVGVLLLTREVSVGELRALRR